MSFSPRRIDRPSRLPDVDTCPYGSAYLVIIAPTWNFATASRSDAIRSLEQTLVESGTISPQELEQIVVIQSKESESFIAAALESGLVDDRELAAAVSRHLGVPYVDVSDVEIEAGLLKEVPAEIARQHTILPLQRRGNRLALAMVDPGDMVAIDAARFATDYDVQPVVTPHEQLLAAIERFYGMEPPKKRKAKSKPTVKMKGVETGKPPKTTVTSPTSTDEAPIVSFVNDLIADALDHKASDIHLEGYAERFRIRYRVDGILHEVLSPELAYRDAIVSRLKIMANLDIAERRLPQDGAIRFDADGEPVDIRISTAPTINGEKVALRLLRKSNIDIPLEELGFSKEQLEIFDKAIGAQNGVILVTGPTGSGKTTTLYAAIKILNDPTRNIMTVEDPVEYELDGVNQINANTEIGLSFARALRGFLRQDPNVILVGEVRDAETANICIQAALTGHLVFSTVHTNDAVGTINRLTNMG
ncbi:Flp pilus assembly complex ATPase component TadA, partial [bacterium]|nr:Flp pilus assembly complex ATPase component TadA [bacterium]